MSLIIGVDVGGTNTDVAILHKNKVIGWNKSLTQHPIINGVVESITKALHNCQENGYNNVVQQVKRVHIGTTHFINAVLKRKGLDKVACIRLCGKATHCLPPLCDFPDDLIEHVNGGAYLLEGGFEYNGKLISEVDHVQVIRTLNQIAQSEVEHVAVTGVFSPNNPAQEEQIGQLIKQHHPNFTYTLSSDFGHLGLLERENTTVLNESLKALCKETIHGFKNALKSIGLLCPLYFTQNDGTLISEEDTVEYPVYTFSSGATNSMRGAAYLAGIKDAIIVDIGGTSTDVGMLVNGFPREASTRIKIGGVNTNFRMPDTKSIGLGGGSHVKIQNNKVVDVGPDSVEYNIKKEAVIFGGTTLVATDIAVAAGWLQFGDKSKVASLNNDVVKHALYIIKKKIETVIDCVKLSAESCPVVLVGGGSILVDENNALMGASQIIKPSYYQVANDVGAALGQVSGSYNALVSITDETREKIIADAKQTAINKAVGNGALRETCVVSDVSELQMAYISSDHVRLKVRVIGDLEVTDTLEEIKINTADPKLENLLIENRKFPENSSGEEISDESVEKEKETPVSITTPDTECLPVVRSGEWFISSWDAECLTIGAGVLGCGGGGSPYLGSIRLKQCIQQKSIPRVVHIDSLKDDDMVYCVAFMGAPLIYTEMLPSGAELLNALQLTQCMIENGFADSDITDEYRKKQAEKLNVDLISEEDGNTVSFKVNRSLGDMKPPVALMCCEVGGLNTLEPLILAAHLDIPVVDCDGMGRAFPQLQQFGPFMYGCPVYPAVITSMHGNSVCCLKTNSSVGLENFFRKHCIEMGCIAGVCISYLTKKDILNHTVKNTISKARLIGNAVLNARKGNVCPIQALVKETQGKLICQGKISDVRRATKDGFAQGHIIIESTDNQQSDVHINFQNEFIICKDITSCNIIATSPDLITLVATETGEPITTDEVKYGLRVSVIVLPSAPLMCTETALKFTGPNAFNYDTEYKPIGGFIQCESIVKI